MAKEKKKVVKKAAKKKAPKPGPQKALSDPQQAILDGLSEITNTMNQLGDRIGVLEAYKEPFRTEEYGRQLRKDRTDEKIGKSLDAKDNPVVKKYKHAVSTGDAQIGQDGVLAFKQSEDPNDDSVDMIKPESIKMDSTYDLLGINEAGQVGSAALNGRQAAGMTPKQRRKAGLPPPPKSESWKKAMMFYAEKVSIHIQDTAEPNADGVFCVGVNGTQYMFIRGQDYSVPRHVVEGLARAKPISYKNEEYTTEDGRRDYRQPFKTGVRYNFHVIYDPSGEAGEIWLRNVLSQI